MKKVISNNIYMFKFLFKFSPKYILWTLFIAICSSISSVALIILMRYALDIFLYDSIEMFLRILIKVGVFQIVFYILSAYYSYILSPISTQQFQKKMYGNLFDKAVKVELSKYDDPEFFNMYTMALENSGQRALAVLSSFMTLLTSIFSIALLVGIVSLIDMTILLFVIASVAINFFVNLKMSKLSYELNLSKVYPRRKIAYTQRVFYLKDFAKEIRLSEIPKALISLFTNSYDDMKNLTKEYGSKQSLISSIQSVLQVLVSIGTILYLVFKMLASSITAGTFALLFNSSNQLSSSVSSLFSVIPQFVEHSLYIEHFKKFLEIEEEPYLAISKLDKFESLEFRDVSYCYGKNSKEAVKGLNFNIKRGEKIAIVGYNGAGKSTVAKMALDLYNPTSGNILLNGKPFKDYSQKEVQSNMGAIFQDFQLYSIPLIENILQRPIIDRDADEACVANALKRVGLYDKIMQFPQGIYTFLSKELDEDGAVFSGGELQKLAIARILAIPRQFVVLDEPSSALDAKSERELFDTVLDEYREHTVVIISHRLSNICNMDCVMYLDNGEIYEVGTHDELMSKQGKYYELFMLQSSNYSQGII